MADTRRLSLSILLLGAAIFADPALALAAPAAPLAATKARSTLLLTTMIAEGGALHAPAPAEAELAPLAASLDALLADTAQDLGLAIDRGPRPAPDPAHLGDAELLDLARSSGGVLLLPSLRATAAASRDVELRLVLADPAARSLLVRSERVARDDVPVRAVVLLRDLVADLRGASGARPPAIDPGARANVISTAPPRGSGRAVLLGSSTLFGGFAGYSIQRASGSSDPRVLYPLLAVGAGIGLGASIIASDEWEVSAGEAWYVAAGATWPTLAGHLLYQGRFSPRVESDRWVFGLIGGTTGVTLSILGLTLHGMSDGGALLSHSGGTFGLVLGGLTEALVRGDIQHTPFTGMGHGAGLGWLAAAALATQLRVPPSRVLTVDIGALIGGLGGAAIGSPLLLHEPDAAHQRGWITATGGGALLGATIAVIATRGGKKAEEPGKKRAELPPVLPGIEVLGESAIGTLRAPIVGLSLRGALP